MFISRHPTFYSQAVLHFRLLLVVLLLQWSCQDTRRIEAKPQEKVSGEPAPRGRFPYICSLRRRRSHAHMCAGTLFKSQWVITAAHCMERQYVGMNPIAYCGVYERNERSQSKMFTTDRTFIHPQWNGNISKGYDIALIKLDRTSDSSLPEMDAQGSLYTLGNVFSTLGWGHTSSGGNADVLRIADRLPFVSGLICNRETYWAGQITESMICAGTGEQNIGEGDSGSPLLQLNLLDGDYTLGQASSDILVGITSFGERAQETLKPGVYTSIGYFRDWIDCIIEEREDCLRGNDKAPEPSSAPKEAQSTTNVTPPLEPDSQPSHASEPSSISPDTSGEPSAEASEPLAQGSEEVTQRLEDILDLCPEVTMQRIVTESFALERAREAIAVDDSDIVAGLLCKGLSPNIEFSLSSFDSNSTLMHEAAEYDAFESAKILVEYEANIEKQNSRPHRPLHTAAQNNSVRVAKLLINSGARIEHKNVLVWQPLHVAAYYDSKDVAKLLIDSGAALENTTRMRGAPLHFAAQGDSSRVTKLLLRRGASIESVDFLNARPLHRTAWGNAPTVAKLLIDARANINSKNVVGSTPLHDAAWWGALEVAEVLVDSGAHVDTKDNEGETPLHHAAKYNRIKIAEFLIEKGAIKTVKDRDGDTPSDEICTSADPPCTDEQIASLQRLLKS